MSKAYQSPNDDLGRTVKLAGPPRRIISLVPSLTETLVSWGLLKRIAGISKYCIHPAEDLSDVPNVGGTKDPDMEAIRSLNPDLVLVNAEENRKEDVDLLERTVPCFVTFPKTVQQTRDMLLRLGTLLACQNEAAQTVDCIDSGLSRAKTSDNRLANGELGRKALYLIWRGPYMSINHDTYIHDLLQTLGFVNAVADRSDRYFEVTHDEIQSMDLDWILLPSEPYPFQQKHAEELSKAANIPLARITLLPGEDYCWFGIRTASVFDTHFRWLANLSQD